MPGPELIASYDGWLVTVSVIVAALASYAALDLSARISVESSSESTVAHV